MKHFRKTLYFVFRKRGKQNNPGYNVNFNHDKTLETIRRPFCVKFTSLETNKINTEMEVVGNLKKNNSALLNLFQARKILFFLSSFMNL